MKNGIIVLLIILLLFLGYRVFDLGVSLTYADDEIGKLQKEILIISKFQGRDCEEVMSDSEFKDGVFIKSGKIVIEGVEFECKNTGAAKKLLFSVVENKQ